MVIYFYQSKTWPKVAVGMSEETRCSVGITRLKRCCQLRLPSAGGGCTAGPECELADAIGFCVACKACGSRSLTTLFKGYFYLAGRAWFGLWVGSPAGVRESQTLVARTGGRTRQLWPRKRCRSFRRPDDGLHRGFHKVLQIFLLKKRKSKVHKTSEILLLWPKALLFQWLVPLVLFSGLNVCAYPDPILPSPISNMNKMGYYYLGDSPWF